MGFFVDGGFSRVSTLDRKTENEYNGATLIIRIAWDDEAPKDKLPKPKPDDDSVGGF